MDEKIISKATEIAKELLDTPSFRGIKGDASMVLFEAFKAMFIAGAEFQYESNNQKS